MFSLTTPWNTAMDGEGSVVDIVPGLVAIGTSAGTVLIYHFAHARQGLRLYLKIPPPSSSTATSCRVTSVKLYLGVDKANVFVAYQGDGNAATVTTGLCCYDMPAPIRGFVGTLSAPLARHDLDGRHVASSNLLDAYPSSSAGLQLTVVR